MKDFDSATGAVYLKASTTAPPDQLPDAQRHKPLPVTFGLWMLWGPPATLIGDTIECSYVQPLVGHRLDRDLALLSSSYARQIRPSGRAMRLLKEQVLPPANVHVCPAFTSASGPRSREPTERVLSLRGQRWPPSPPANCRCRSLTPPR